MRFTRRPEIHACGIVLTFLTVLLCPPSLPGVEPRVQATEPSASSLWLAPSRQTGQRSAMAAAVEDLADGKAAAAAPVFLHAIRDPELGGYARLYLGRTQLALGKAADAAVTAKALVALQPGGYLGEAALWLDVEGAEASNDWSEAIRALQVLTGTKSLDPEQAILRLGRAAVKAGDVDLAARSLMKVYYEYPLSSESASAAFDLVKLLGPMSLPSLERLSLEVDRADALYSARRYSDARAAFVLLEVVTTGETRALIDVRIAACDFYLKRYAAARDELRPLLDATFSHQLEAQFFYFSTLRELGQSDQYVAMARAFVDAHPAHALAEETLNSLGTHFILTDDDEKAAAVLGELYSRFPQGSHADRAAWRAGWWAYKTGDYRSAIRIFESAATAMSRADYRPPWLYWAARAHARLNETEAAVAGYRQVIASYRNSYYGRLAMRVADEQLRATGAVGFGQISPARRELPPSVTPGVPPPNADMIRRLLAAGLYDDAIRESQKAQVEQGSSPLLEATIAYALNRKGELRPAITAMRRAYPQFMAEGGEALPDDIRRVIFPVAYWDLISREAAAHNLDPYLMLALVAQESTFQADVRSSANAWGLMQIEPATGRQYASRLHIRPFNTARLTQPAINVRIGMASFADRLKKFGSVAATLAAYNAGDSRVVRWLADRPHFTQDEFIDDIPFPETQNYVKRILGTAEDYRMLYRDLKMPVAVKKSK